MIIEKYARRADKHIETPEWLFKLFCEAKRVYLDKVSLQILCWNITYI